MVVLSPVQRLQPGFAGVAERVLAGTLRHYGRDLISLAVFGSVARGEARPDSDLDVMIVARNLPAGRMKRAGQFVAVEAQARTEAAGILISPVFKTPEELERGSPLLFDMTEHVALLHDKEGYLANRIAEVRRRLRNLGAHKVRGAQGDYWILKEPFTPGEIFDL